MKTENSSENCQIEVNKENKRLPFTINKNVERKSKEKISKIKYMQKQKFQISSQEQARKKRIKFGGNVMYNLQDYLQSDKKALTEKVNGSVEKVKKQNENDQPFIIHRNVQRKKTEKIKQILYKVQNNLAEQRNKQTQKYNPQQMFNYFEQLKNNQMLDVFSNNVANLIKKEVPNPILQSPIDFTKLPTTNKENEDTYSYLNQAAHVNLFPLMTAARWPTTNPMEPIQSEVKQQQPFKGGFRKFKANNSPSTENSTLPSKQTNESSDSGNMNIINSTIMKKLDVIVKNFVPIGQKQMPYEKVQ